MQKLVKVRKDYIESMEATIETLDNKEVMRDIEESERDIREGRVRNIDELIKEIREEENEESNSS